MKIWKQHKVFLCVCIVFLICTFYDLVRGQNDGLIGNVYFYRLFFRIFLLCIIAYILVYYSKSKSSIIKVIAYNTIFTFVFIFLFEGISFVYFTFFNSTALIKPSHVLWLDNPAFIPQGSDKQKYYGDLSQAFGRWRAPNATLNVERCGDNQKITYASNSMGARDIERLKTGKARVVFLGDSFTEGVLVNQSDRLSTILESKSKVPHLNFGINGANPLVYYSIYKNQVLPNFEHDGIVVGIFLGNDFESSFSKINASFLNMPIYRPFWKKAEQTGFAAIKSLKPVINYTLADVKQSFESHRVLENPKELRKTRDSLFSTLPFYKKIWVDLETNSYLLNFVYLKSYEIAKKNYFKNYQSNFEKAPLGTDRAVDFEYSLHNLIESAKGKKVVFLLIPDIYDINQFKKSKANDLKSRLEVIYGTENLKIIDLLPAFASYPGDPQNLFIKCDGHWNEAGNAYAADILNKNPDYQAFLNTISLK
jgi:hypothetical protein